MFFQDPDFHNTETDLLTALGATVLEAPDAANYVDNNTFVLALSCVSEVFFDFGVCSLPAVFVGNDATFMHKNELYSCHKAAESDPGELENLPMYEALIDEAVEKFQVLYQQIPVSDFEMMDMDEFSNQHSLGPFFNDAYIYWRKDSAQWVSHDAPEQTVDILEKILREVEESYEEYKATGLAIDDGKDGNGEAK